MLTPSIGSCLNPFTSSGGLMPINSYSVGTMSLTWWNCDRGILSGLMPLGHETTSGLRVPPKCAATNFVDLNGVLPAHAHPAWYMLSTFGPPSAGIPPSLLQGGKLLLRSCSGCCSARAIR